MRHAAMAIAEGKATFEVRVGDIAVAIGETRAVPAVKSGLMAKAPLRALGLLHVGTRRGPGVRNRRDQAMNVWLSYRILGADAANWATSWSCPESLPWQGPQTSASTP